MNGYSIFVSAAAVACLITCGGGDSESPPASRAGSGATDNAPAAGRAGSESGTGSGEGGHGDDVTSPAGAGGEASEYTPTPYESSCEEQQCTAEERCVPGPAGTYCVHECAGQPCPPGPAQVSYCTRTGGVICASE